MIFRVTASSPDSYTRATELVFVEAMAWILGNQEAIKREENRFIEYKRKNNYIEKKKKNYSSKIYL